MDPIFGDVAASGPAHLQGVVGHVAAAPAAAANVHAPALTCVVCTARIALADTPLEAYRGVHKAPRGIAVPKPLLDLLVRQVTKEGIQAVVRRACATMPTMPREDTLPSAVAHLAAPAAAGGAMARRRDMLIWLNAGLTHKVQVAYAPVVLTLADAADKANGAISRLICLGNAVAHPRVFSPGTDIWHRRVFFRSFLPARPAAAPAAAVVMPHVGGGPLFPPRRVIELLPDHYGDRELVLVCAIVEWAAMLHACAVAAAGSPPPAPFAAGHPAWAVAHPGVGWAW